MINMPKKREPEPTIPKSYRRAVQLMDAALQKNAPANYHEQIEIFGRQHFGALWKPRNPDEIGD
jgi:hypothetical protein